MRGDLVEWAWMPGSQDRAETEDHAQGLPNLRVQRKQRKGEGGPKKDSRKIRTGQQKARHQISFKPAAGSRMDFGVVI